MTIPTWPSSFLTDGSPEVTRIDKNIVNTSQGGREFTLNLWPVPRFRYTFHYVGLREFVAAPAPLQAYSEVGAVLYLVDCLKGTFGQCYVTDPATKRSVLCRLASDELTITRDESAPWWRGSVSFISVL